MKGTRERGREGGRKGGREGGKGAGGGVLRSIQSRSEPESQDSELKTLNTTVTL